MPISDARKTELRATLLNVAIQEFLAHGYAEASIDNITRGAGGSKSNVYVHFGSKEGLFAAAVEALCRKLLSPLRSIPLGVGDVSETLSSFGIAFLDATLSEEAIGLVRLVIAETPRFPGIATMFLSAGPVFAQEMLADYLELDSVRESLGSDLKGSMISTLFIDMISRDLMLRQLLGVGPRSSGLQRRQIVESAVSLILQKRDR